MNYSNPMCVTCHYDEKSKRVNAMIRIANMLNMLNLNIRDIKQYRKIENLIGVIMIDAKLD